MKETLFQSLTNDQKIDFFVKCQELLINYHPNSEFTFRDDNVNERKLFVYDFITKYKGYVYFSDNVCVLFNKVKVENPTNPVKTVKDHLYKEPNKDYNAYSIDFVVFRKLIDCLTFCKQHYEEKIKYVVFVRNNDIKLYYTDKLLAKLDESLKHPLAVFV